MTPSPQQWPDKQTFDDSMRLKALREEADAVDAAAAAAPVHHSHPRGSEGEPFQGLDRTGMPPVQELGRLETNAFRRLSPRRNRWPELVAIDERVADLERRQGEAGQRLRELCEQLANAPNVDAEQLATWELDGRKGPRPQSSRPAIEAQIDEAETEVDGLEIAVGRELAAKAAYVEKHRPRLVKDADKATAEAHERAIALVDELAAARTALVELRATAVWAALYPAEGATRGPREALIAGGMAKPTRETLGVDHEVEHGRTLAALRADADYWRTAATPEQRKLLGGDAKPKDGAVVWVDTDEGREQSRRELQERRDRYEREWGKPPPW